MNHAPDQYGPPLPPLRQCNSNKGGGQVKAEATKRSSVTATRMTSNVNDDGNGGKKNGNGNKGWQASNSKGNNDGNDCGRQQ